MTVLLIVSLAVLAWFLTALLRRYALARSLLDVPNARSSHSLPTPRGGGVAIVVAFLAGLCLAFFAGLGIAAELFYALLGLAVIASQRGNGERAQALYLQVLESDPGNVTAQAALINMRGQSSAARSESRLKTLIAKQPDSAALFFALGNLYAGQSRWSEAQQAYFQSYSLEPGNADHVFNVAVSLDHLRQKKLAAQYYRMALTAAETSPSAFDKNAAAQRILDLQQ